ncbi:MAG: FUN14 domain-containing protein [Phycisphaerales bacterium]
MADEKKDAPTPRRDAKQALPPDAGPLQRFRNMAVWKQALVAISVVLMGTGVALPFMFPATAPAQTAPAGDLPPGAQGFAPTDSGEAGGAGDPASESGISPALFRLGFSFFVGFAIAFAVRSFIKVSLAVVGLYLLLTFGLEYAGLLEVRWGAVAEQYDSVAAWLRAETGSFRSFITGRVPAAGAALAGLGIGFTRK